MKKGQILGMPLVLIFALIVGALVLGYGAKVALDLVEEAEYVQVLEFLDDIENNIETFSNYDTGSAKIYVVDLPTDVEHICFSTVGEVGDCYSNGQLCEGELGDTMDLLLEDTYNVYLIPQGLYDRNRFNIAAFQVEGGNPVCVSNGASILVTAYDDYVGIQYYEQ